VTWDLRYPTPPAIRFNYGDTMGAVPGDTPFTPQGPLAVPGNYTVKLNVDGTSYAQPLLMKEDPRIGDSSEVIDGMQKQLALAQKIVTVLAASKAAYEQGTAVEAKLGSSKPAEALQASLMQLTGTFDDATIGLSGSNYAVPPVKGAVSLSRTNGQAAALLHLVSYLSDSAPVPSQYATYQQLCADFNIAAMALQALQPELAKLNVQFVPQTVPTLACQKTRRSRCENVSGVFVLRSPQAAAAASSTMRPRPSAPTERFARASIESTDQSPGPLISRNSVQMNCA
jgi:hypothetical protein